MAKLFSINEAAAEAFGRPVSPFSVRRWVSRGVGSPPVKLKAKRVGGQYFVAESDAQDFLEALADPALFTRRQHDERVETAKQRLREQA